MKDFKVGDRVTAVIGRNGVFAGFVVSCEYRSVAVVAREGQGIQDAQWYCDDNVFHGHNVTVKVEGEELPDRLRTEQVTVTLKKKPGGSSVTNGAGRYPYQILPSGDYVCCVGGGGSGVEYVNYELELPADLAKQVREYLAGKGPTA